MLIPVILSGGAGTRLWPVSREAHPKPFMRLADGQSLLQKTLQRCQRVDGVERILTITNRDYYFQTRDEYSAVVAGGGLDLDYILEPLGRNTAPAITLAATYLNETEAGDPVMLVLPADHVIDNVDAFNAAAQTAYRLARDGYLVTFGIRPTRADTGYGYVKHGQSLTSGDGGCGTFLVERFTEKPDRDTAESFLQSGGYLWNAGMFCFRPSVLLEAVQQHAPEIAETAAACWQATSRDEEPVELDADSFCRMPGTSIDYAVMEQADNVATVACEFDWSDVGSWDAVSELMQADADGNRISGEALAIDTANCYVHSDDRLVATVGVDNLVVIDTPDALLVADRERTQDVKRVVERLKREGHECYRLHRTVHRPWGTYTVLEEGDRFKIKRIVVKPGAELSLQMHHHRSEHWVVVSGTAKVVNGEKDFLVRTNESTYVPAGNHHRLTNPGVVDLVMIEVQSGEYLGEDDIVRFDDNYGRS